MTPTKDEQAEAEKRSEAAKKAAKTRKRNAEEAENGNGEADGDVNDPSQVQGQEAHSASLSDPLEHESHVEDKHAGRANDDSEVSVAANRENDAAVRTEDKGDARSGTQPAVIAPGAEHTTNRRTNVDSTESFLTELRKLESDIQARDTRIEELTQEVANLEAQAKENLGKGKGSDAGTQALAALNSIRKRAEVNGHVDAADVIATYDDTGLEWEEHRESAAGV